MATYLIRVKETKEMVGIVVADDADDLYLTIDESVDPGICESLEIRSGQAVFLDGLVVDGQSDDECSLSWKPAIKWQTGFCELLSSSEREWVDVECRFEEIYG